MDEDDGGTTLRSARQEVRLEPGSRDDLRTHAFQQIRAVHPYLLHCFRQLRKEIDPPRRILTHTGGTGQRAPCYSRSTARTR